MDTLERIQTLPKTTTLEGKLVLVTGCGYKPLRNTFYDITTNEPSHDPIYVNEEEMKTNIGSAVAAVLARNGADVHMVSTSPEKLENIKNAIQPLSDANVNYSAHDLLSEEDVSQLVENLPSKKELYWVQSVGLGAGSYRLKDDNPYLYIPDIPLELLEAESSIVLKSTHLLAQKLLPRFKEQDESRINIITSMSAIRGYARGATHCAAKAAIDKYTNSAMLELYKDNIFVTSIRPGGVDTGMYDGKTVQNAAVSISDSYNGMWNEVGLRLAPPSVVGQAAMFALSAPAHIPSINLVAKSQFPHEGS